MQPLSRKSLQPERPSGSRVFFFFAAWAEPENHSAPLAGSKSQPLPTMVTAMAAPPLHVSCCLPFQGLEAALTSNYETHLFGILP